MFLWNMRLNSPACAGSTNKVKYLVRFLSRRGLLHDFFENQERRVAAYTATIWEILATNKH